MKLRGLGTFATAVMGTAWASLSWDDATSIFIGFVFLCITLFCIGYRWGEYYGDRNYHREDKP